MGRVPPHGIVTSSHMVAWDYRYFACNIHRMHHRSRRVPGIRRRVLPHSPDRWLGLLVRIFSLLLTILDYLDRHHLLPFGEGDLI